MSCFKLNKNRPVKMVSTHENSNWKNLSMELYELCITIIFALSHFGPLVSVGDHRVQNDPVTGGLVFENEIFFKIFSRPARLSFLKIGFGYKSFTKFVQMVVPGSKMAPLQGGPGFEP